MSSGRIGGKRYIVKLNERVAIITEENISRLSHLYGEIDIDDLSRIVNNHLKVAIDEIEEDYMWKERGNSDIIQMNTNIVLTDKEGKAICKSSRTRIYV